MSYSLLISILSVVIAGGGFWFSIRKYRKHEKRLNEQQEEINEYILKEKKEEENAQKMANLKIKAEWSGRYKGATMLLTCTNIGHSKALNIRFELGELKNRIEVIKNSNIQNKDSIYPGGKRDILEFLPISLGGQPTWNIKIFWDDDFEKDRYKVYPINIPD